MTTTTTAPAAEVTLTLDKPRAELQWRMMFREMDALESEFSQPAYSRRPVYQIESEVITLRNMIRDIRPLCDLSEESMQEMFDGYGFTF